MQLTINTPAPELPAVDYLGNPIGSAGRHGVLLSFFRYADCPICNLRIRDLRKSAPDLAAAGLEILAVFQSPAAQLAKSLGNESWPFPLIADHDQGHYRRWGVTTSWARLMHPINIKTAWQAMQAGHMPGRIDGPVHRMPADFVVKQNRIALAHYGRDAGDHLPLNDVWSWLKTQT